MTPAPSATKPHTARPTRRRPAQRPPRRVSGPAPRRARPGPPAGAVAVTPPLGLRLARTGGRIVDARFLDRLLRGRVWIAILAVGLMGIVFIQVSMLRLNAGISRAITSAETLHHQNSTLRADISKLDSSARIADAAKTFGLIQPAAGSVRYLDARRADGAAAARGIHPPKAAKTATGTAATTTTAAAAPAPAPAAQATTAPSAAAATQAQAVTPPPATTTTTQAQAATSPPATSPPAAQTQQQTQQTQQTQTQPTQPTQQQPAQAQPPAAVTPAGGVTATGAGGQ